MEIKVKIQETLLHKIKAIMFYCLKCDSFLIKSITID